MASYAEDDDDLEPSSYGGLLGDGSLDGSSNSVDDHRDMLRMGKAQQLRRNFNQFTITCLSCLMMGTWELLFVANVQGLANGGHAGMFWTYFLTLGGLGCIVASLAELASMAPTSGGQYHWVSEFAPLEYQKPLSYAVGWMSTLSWQAGQASWAVMTGSIIEALILYIHTSWIHSSLRETYCICAVVFVCFVGNVWFSQHLPTLQNILIVYHILGFFFTLGMFVSISSKIPTSHVMTQFTNLGGWSNMPVAVMVGQASSLWALACSDGVVHMSEETKDAALTIPRAMWWSYLINGGTSLIFLLFMLRAIPDITGSVSNPTGYPFLYIITLAMPSSLITTSVIVCAYIVWAALIGVGFSASASRQTYAFARDRGLPLARSMSYVHPRLMVPITSVAVTCMIPVGLSLANVGSHIPFTAVISVQVLSLMLTYVVCIGCVLHKRLQAPHTMPPARWSLGSWGVSVNCGALGYATFASFWLFWPITTARVLTNFNWSGVVIAVVLGFALLSYALHGHSVYRGPVALVQERRDQHEMYGARPD